MVRFVEGKGGRIIDAERAETVCTVNVDDLTTEDAHTMVNAIIKALDETFRDYPLVEPGPFRITL